MDVCRVHERRFPIGDLPGTLIDSLAAAFDPLWPYEYWPPMVLDGPLAVGARGGHGRLRYEVSDYIPGQSVSFRFLAPQGFEGGHRFEVILVTAHQVVFRHTLALLPRGRARITWPLIYGPLHDALIEDALAKAERALGYQAAGRPWSPWVKLLRLAKIP